LVKLFISANISISQLKNPFFYEALDKAIREKCHDYHTLRHKILPEVMKILFNAIQTKLQNAEFVFLMTDLWTDFQNTDFIALAAIIVDSFWDREFIVLDFKEMDGEHNAENILTAIEKMVNQFEFDKSSVKSKTKIRILNLIT